MSFLWRLLATAGYSGFFPVASGTAGSLVAVAIWCFAPLPLGQNGIDLACIGFLAAVSLVGVPASRWGEEEYGEDGSPIVFDEVAGQWIALAGMPVTPVAALLGFVLFRFFDIFKPWPARQLEAVPGGWGVMLDDVVAGIYAALVMHAILYSAPGVLG